MLRGRIEIFIGACEINADFHDFWCRFYVLAAAQIRSAYSRDVELPLWVHC